MRVRILISDDPRFRFGEVGIVLEECDGKYDYFVRLDGEQDTPFGVVRRDYFFHADEVEVVG